MSHCSGSSASASVCLEIVGTASRGRHVVNATMDGRIYRDTFNTGSAKARGGFFTAIKNAFGLGDADVIDLEQHLFRQVQEWSARQDSNIPAITDETAVPVEAESDPQTLAAANAF